MRNYNLFILTLEVTEHTPDTPTSNGQVPSANGGVPNSMSNGNPRANGAIPKSNSNVINGTANKKLTPNGRIGNGRSNVSPGNTLTRGGSVRSTTTIGSTQSTESTLQNSHIDSIQTEASKPDGLVVAMHRKMVSLFKSY